MPLRAILFDHDGTLVNSEPIHFDLWVTVLSRYGISLTEQQYKEHYAGVPTNANAIDVVRRFQIDVTPEAIAEEKNAATREFLRGNSFPLMNGALDAIMDFRERGLTLGIVTGAGFEGVDATLRANDLGSVFSAVVSGDDVSLSKPAPDCYLLAMKKLGVQASECVAIEDTQHGLKAAHAAGIRCLAVPTPMSMHHDFGDALAVLDGMPNVIEYVRHSLLR
ncbi:HAD family hydrolase [Salinispirillum marinum]|uniref:HAD family hydrolase n=2 Tax=Saccharospirillaceae TaxID=255527 RepID=A0ABV8BJ78_9GAMM